MIGKNLFDFFGLTEEANEDDLKKRYRILVKKYHPDKNKSKDAKAKFQELKRTYDDLLLLIKSRESLIHSPKEASVEEQWQKYRRRAREIANEKRKKQAEDMNLWYDRLLSGKTWFYTKVVCFSSALVLIILFIDLFLPKIYESDYVIGYDSISYHSIDEHRISRVLTSKGKTYWLDRYNNGFFNFNPFVKIEKTGLLHSPISFQKYEGFRYLKIPIELTIYWSQIIIFIALLISVGLYFYKKRDVFFIMGSYYTRFFIGPFILWFLISNNRWIHIFTLGIL
jgi:curved DNA-binding protein CbpA